MLFYDESDIIQLFPNSVYHTRRRKLEGVNLYKNFGVEWSEDLTPINIIYKTIQVIYYGNNNTQSTSTTSKEKDAMSIVAKFSGNFIQECTGNAKDFKD